MSIIPLVDALTPVVNKVLSFIPDPQQKKEAEQSLISSLQTWDLQQAAINQAEASNPSVFVSGARPAALWVCVFALGYQYIFVPFAGWGLSVYMMYHPELTVPPLPVLDNNLWQLMTGLLGLGGLRTYEKLKGVA